MYREKFWSSGAVRCSSNMCRQILTPGHLYGVMAEPSMSEQRAQREQSDLQWLSSRSRHRMQALLNCGTKMTALPCTCPAAALSRLTAVAAGTRHVLFKSAWQTGQLRAFSSPQPSRNACNVTKRTRQGLSGPAATRGDSVLQPRLQDNDNSAFTPAWDVVGLGQAMVDLSATVDDDFLVRLGVIKGSRR